MTTRVTSSPGPATWSEAMALLSPDWFASLTDDERADFAAIETAEADCIAATYGMSGATDGRHSLLIWQLVGRGGECQRAVGGFALPAVCA